MEEGMRTDDDGEERKNLMKNHEKMKILCLHGFRTSGSFLQKQISKWDPSIFTTAHFDLVFPDGKFPAGGKSEIEGIFPPPYFEWFQFNKDFTEYQNLDECISYLCEYITKNGPFDGLLGFSQGAALSALLLGYQAQGKVLKDHPSMKLFVSISGSKFRDPSISEIAYKDPIKVKSVHFIGAKDWLQLPSEDLATAFHNPLVIRHPQGHTVPRLDEATVEQLRDWTRDIILQSSSTCGSVAEMSSSTDEATVEQLRDWTRDIILQSSSTCGSVAEIINGGHHDETSAIGGTEMSLGKLGVRGSEMEKSKQDDPLMELDTMKEIKQIA